MKISSGISGFLVLTSILINVSCLADLDIFPSVGSMFGGEQVFLLGPRWDAGADIRCRFLYNNNAVQTVTGSVLSKEAAVCVPDPFYLSGELKMEVSVNGGHTYTYSQIYTIANLDRIFSSGVTRVNSDDLNWYRAGFDLEVRWDATKLADNANITITVLAYLEDGSQGPRWEEFYQIAENTGNDGSYDFEGVAQSGVSEDNAFGAIRIHDANNPNGLKFWSDIHALGYILNQEYQDNPIGWSSIKCDEWSQNETSLPDFVDELMACPCTLQQAIADSGRFQPDTGCSIYSGSVCKYHQGAKHCVRSVAASETTSSGTQCCYQDNGDLMFAGDTDQGSTADRSHVWGAAPYQTIDTVPAATFGDPHFITFDNLQYTFNGKGEFTLVEVPSYNFELQGRTEQAVCLSCAGNDTGIPQKVTSLTAIAMKEDTSDTIHVELDKITTMKFVRKYSGITEIVSFHDQFWLDFNGVSVVVVESEGENIMKATITYWNPNNMSVKGLFGNWDSSSENDLIARNSEQLDPEKATPEEIRNFGYTWEVEQPTLFYYETGGHTDYQDNDFIPVYEAPDRSTLPPDFVNDMDRICGDNEQCVFDMSLTRNTDVGELTMEAVNYDSLAKKYTQPVTVCPYIATPRNGTKNYQTDQENTLVGAHIIFECAEGFTLTGSPERICHENGEWTGEGDNDCVATGCNSLEPPNNGYIDIRFEDGEVRAETICEEGYLLQGSAIRRCVNGKWTGSPATCTKLSAGQKASVAVGVILAVAILIVVIIVVIRFIYKNSGEDDLDKGTKVKEAGQGENWGMEAEVDDASAENGIPETKTNNLQVLRRSNGNENRQENAIWELNGRLNSIPNAPAWIGSLGGGGWARQASSAYDNAA
ncbi:sushi domain-containing protein 2-like [Amphiura filiformis]|uniref:sushi domain-containing protein 2-like n=1 Tax=Amphiura filiformis TaxID=82378 RepID=UPI003B215109